MCGTCHIDTHSEWQDSAHGEGELACVRCHNPHTAELKAASMEELCSNCHSDEGGMYGLTVHAQQGLTCTDCHLRISEGELGEGHGQREHTFDVDLATCTECHGQEMHIPLSAEQTSGDTELAYSAYEPTTLASCEVEDSQVASEPQQPRTRSFNYLLIAAVGMGCGVALTPWMEGFYRRLSGRHQG
jgi:predicted CXXCH cytochrome family protein